MKQLELFNEPVREKKGTEWKLYVDGAARNNPGPAGAGIYILKNNIKYAKYGYYLGSRTNNQAEYLALLLGLFHVTKDMQSQDTLHIISDSELLVRQLQGRYKVKDSMLKKLHAIAQQLIQLLHTHIDHVLREDNKEADELANVGIDKKKKIPPPFIAFLQQHEITL